MKHKTMYDGYLLNVYKARFGNGQTCLVLAEDIKPTTLFMKASIAIEGVVIKDNQTIIRDFSENKGILASLVKSGIVEDTGVTVPTGFCVGHIVNILEDLEDWY